MRYTSTKSGKHYSLSREMVRVLRCIGTDGMPKNTFRIDCSGATIDALISRDLIHDRGGSNKVQQACTPEGLDIVRQINSEDQGHMF